MTSANEPAFTNEPIAVGDLPQLGDEAFEPVDPRYLRASLAGSAITAIVVLAIGAFAATRAEETWIPLAIAGGVLFFVALGVVLRILEVRRLAYQVREHDISMRSGVITHQVQSVPFARVQHVRVNRGAIERALGLATLQISSAGPNITIPGLTEPTAERIKLLVTERAGMTPDDAAPTTDPTLTKPEVLAPRFGGPQPPVPPAPGTPPAPPVAPATPPIHRSTPPAPAPPTPPPSTLPPPTPPATDAT